MTAAPNGLTIDDEIRGDHRTIAVRGELDLGTSKELATVLEGAAGGGVSRVTLDLHGVSFIDSSALRALVLSGRALAAAGCTLEIGPRSEMVARVLAMTSLDQGNDAFQVLPADG
jgi:anti-sigma B factor antagonist